MFFFSLKMLFISSIMVCAVAMPKSQHFEETTHQVGFPSLFVLIRLSSFSFDVFHAWLPSLTRYKKLDCFSIWEHFTFTVLAVHLINSWPVLPSSQHLISFTPSIFKHLTFNHVTYKVIIVCKGVSTPHFKIIPPLLGSHVFPKTHHPPTYPQISHPKFSLLAEMQ